MEFNFALMALGVGPTKCLAENAPDAKNTAKTRELASRQR